MFFFVKNLIFSAKSGNKFCRGETKIGLISQGEVRRGETQVWNNEPLTIPALPPTKLGGCRLISVDYLLNVNKKKITNDNYFLVLKNFFETKTFF